MNSKSTGIGSEILRGFKASVPIILGFIPVGIAYAVMAKDAGLSSIETILMSVSVFAGASEMMAVGMYKNGAMLAAIVLATFMMNLRHVIMSTCIFEKTEKQGVLKRLFLGFFVTDESFAVITSEKEKCGFWFFASLGVSHYLAWVAGSSIGAFAADLLPATVSASLGIALYAMFIGLLVPGVKGNLKLFLLVLATAALNTCLSIFIESSYSLIISTVAGAFVGVFFVDFDNKNHENTNGQVNEKCDCPAETEVAE